MAQSERVKSFKNELRNYKYYCNLSMSLKDKIEYYYHLLGGVRGIDFAKEPVHSPPNKEREYQLREDISQCERKLELTTRKISEIDEILCKMQIDVRTALICVYVNGEQIRSVASKMYLSHGALQKRFIKAIEEALD